MSYALSVYYVACFTCDVFCITCDVHTVQYYCVYTVLRAMYNVLCCYRSSAAPVTVVCERAKGGGGHCDRQPAGPRHIQPGLWTLGQVSSLCLSSNTFSGFLLLNLEFIWKEKFKLFTPASHMFHFRVCTAFDWLIDWLILMVSGDMNLEPETFLSHTKCLQYSQLSLFNTFIF